MEKPCITGEIEQRWQWRSGQISLAPRETNGFIKREEGEVETSGESHPRIW